MRTAARRRQRSTRLLAAVALLAFAAVVVLASFAADAALLRGLAGLAAVALGAAATKITHSELRQTRREWARDRARQAEAYRRIDERRAHDHLTHLARLDAAAQRRETDLAELELAVVSGQRRVAETTRKFSAEARRADLAEDENVRLGRRVEEAEERAAEAIVHLAELEQEVDVLRAELAAWEALRAEQSRAHA